MNSKINRSPDSAEGTAEVKTPEISLTLEGFGKESQNNGIQYYSKTFDDLPSAILALDEEGVLNLVNRSMEFSQSTRAINLIMKAGGADKVRASGNTTIISEADAKSWLPGDREVLASTWAKRIQDLTAEIKEKRENDAAYAGSQEEQIALSKRERLVKKYKAANDKLMMAL